LRDLQIRMLASDHYILSVTIPFQVADTLTNRAHIPAPSAKITFIPFMGGKGF